MATKVNNKKPGKTKAITLQIPVAVFAQEARDLYNWCKPDKDRLIESGLDWHFAEELPERIDNLVKRQSEWASEYKKRTQRSQGWKIALAEGLALRQKIMFFLNHALHDEPKRARIRKAVNGDRRYSGIVQSFNTLDTFCSEFAGELKRIGFDFKLLELAQQKGLELRDLLEELHTGTNPIHESRALRDQAYLTLKEAVDKVRRYGKFVFIDDNQKLNGYKSDYLQKKWLKQNQKRANSNNIVNILSKEVTQQSSVVLPGE